MVKAHDLKSCKNDINSLDDLLHLILGLLGKLTCPAEVGVPVCSPNNTPSKQSFSDLSQLHNRWRLLKYSIHDMVC
jgi:hypothetical protein